MAVLKKKKKKAAVFDIDGTIFRSSILIELVEGLINVGIFPKRARTEFEHERVRWLERHGLYEEYISAVVKTFERYLKGVYYGDFADCAKEVVARHQGKLYRYTRDLIKKLRSQGYFLLAISQSPKTALDHFARRLGFHKTYGRIYEIGPTDRFTGVVSDLHVIENKANVLKRAVEKENLTLKGSVAVGDTEDDISMLELVEKPICFNPNQKLFRYATRMGWPIIVERKDVIYEIQ